MGPRVKATAFVDRMVGVMGERATVARDVLEQHGRSEAYHGLLPPDVVVFPQTTREVVEIVSLCADLRMPIVPFGAGRSEADWASPPDRQVRPPVADCSGPYRIGRENRQDQPDLQ